MTDKSYVTMEQRLCVVCGKSYDTGTLFMDKRLRDIFEMHTTTGYGMCPEHQKLKDEGWVALIECDPTKTKVKNGHVAHVAEAYRTGEIMHMKLAAYEGTFNGPPPPNMVAFIEPAVMKALKRMAGHSDEDPQPEQEKPT